ncbi:hypothetical protein EV175_004103, partial [Coemansia sp. RSA 1933]
TCSATTLTRRCGMHCIVLTISPQHHHWTATWFWCLMEGRLAEYGMPRSLLA